MFFLFLKGFGSWLFSIAPFLVLVHFNVCLEKPSHTNTFQLFEHTSNDLILKSTSAIHFYGHTLDFVIMDCL